MPENRHEFTKAEKEILNPKSASLKPYTLEALSAKIDPTTV